jgi:hypothetical protein
MALQEERENTVRMCNTNRTMYVQKSWKYN